MMASSWLPIKIIEIPDNFQVKMCESYVHKYHGIYKTWFIIKLINYTNGQMFKIFSTS